MDANSNERFALQIVEAINDRDYDRINQWTTEDVQLRLPPGQVFYGQQGVYEFFRVLEARLPHLIVTARKVHAGPGFAVVEYDTAGDSEDGMGAIVLELEGDRVRRVQLYLDTARWAELSA